MSDGDRVFLSHFRLDLVNFGRARIAVAPKSRVIPGPSRERPRQLRLLAAGV